MIFFWTEKGLAVLDPSTTEMGDTRTAHTGKNKRSRGLLLHSTNIHYHILKTL